jgi:methylamine dehydrogenase accessory protein MauD
MVVLSLARQVGILHERLNPAGVSRAGAGIEPGETLIQTSLMALDGSTVELTGASQDDRSLRALLFVAADCPICRGVLPAFASALEIDEGGLRGYWVADGLPGVDGSPADYQAYADDHRITSDRFVVSQELGLSLGVRQLPALVLLDSDGRLLTRKTLSGPRQVARVIAAHSNLAGKSA